MDRIRLKWSPNSLQSKLLSGMLMLTVPLLIVIILGSQYAISVVRSQVSDSYRNLTTLYMNQVDNELEKVDKYLNSLVASGMQFIAISQAKTENDYYKANISLFNTFQDNLPLYSAVDAFFMYYPDRDDFLSAAKTIDDYSQSIKLQEYIKQMIDAEPGVNGFGSASWKSQEINGEYYILHIMRTEGLYIGAWQKADSMMIPINFISFGTKGGSLFATAEGKAMTNKALVENTTAQLSPVPKGYQLSGVKNQFLVVGAASVKGDFSLIAIIPDEQILENLPYFRWLAVLASIASLLVVLTGLAYLRRIVLVPMNRLLLAMKRIREGNLNIRIERNSGSDEFQVVNHTFNSMMEQIQELTINVYEEKLSKQREELQRLQLQINPHFFLNSLNIIYHLAKVKDYELIKEMSQCLVRYFRFMFRSNLSFVSLKDELEHTANYLRIQELRFPDQLAYSADVPEYLVGELVPPLIIHTFVENTIKHAVTLDQPIHLTIRADITANNNKPYLKLCIEDTGNGFPTDVLLAIRKNKSLVNEQGEHIGIWNVQRRLKLLYGDEASLEISNQLPHGAEVCVMLPMPKVETG
ncbi:sensor histidine kinase [Paenibacillus segetis]|uniref:HAMP domain-containing protein n=1 Tax=Paenibacillus segetis TaxID=1325360 RepID=A0ABQ1YSN9_9BACL|nr:histidine kinase [Paenibacillus segetis]GGH35156.1 hypothetical protein GCM10008013_41300 [Paenibacillus segetis]